MQRGLCSSPSEQACQKRWGWGGSQEPVNTGLVEGKQQHQHPRKSISRAGNSACKGPEARPATVDAPLRRPGQEVGGPGCEGLAGLGKAATSQSLLTGAIGGRPRMWHTCSAFHSGPCPALSKCVWGQSLVAQLPASRLLLPSSLPGPFSHLPRAPARLPLPGEPLRLARAPPGPAGCWDTRGGRALSAVAWACMCPGASSCTRPGVDIMPRWLHPAVAPAMPSAGSCTKGHHGHGSATGWPAGVPVALAFSICPSAPPPAASWHLPLLFHRPSLSLVCTDCRASGACVAATEVLDVWFPSV